MHTTKLFRALVITLALSPALAHAHPGHEVSGFVPGVEHPLMGLDHLLAMIAVGLWAAQLGGRARWAVPASFVGVMSLGGALAMSGWTLPGVEQGILASVLVLGVLVAAAVRLPVAASASLVGAFALFHGFAHGAKMPPNASGLAYGAGFALATAALHALGLAFGSLKQAAPALRLSGAAVAASAVLLMLGWI
jgi:urease accessory protein